MNISFAISLFNNSLVPPSPPSSPESNMYNYALGRNMTDEDFIKSWGYPFTLDIDCLLNNSDTTRVARRNKKKGIKKEPRPPNSFMIYRRNKHAELKLYYQLLQGGTNEKSANFSKVIGNEWKNEPDNVKELFGIMAREAERLHAIKYPDYKYKPKQQKKRNNQQNDNISEIDSDWSDEKFDISKYFPSPTITNTSTDASSSQSDTSSPTFYSTDSPLVDMGGFFNYSDNNVAPDFQLVEFFNNNDDNVGDFLLDQQTNPDNIVDDMQYMQSMPSLNLINTNNESNDYDEFEQFINYNY